VISVAETLSSSQAMLYSLQQLPLIPLCFYSLTVFSVTVKYIIILWVCKIPQQALFNWQCCVILQCEGLWVCCDVLVELLTEINLVILKEKTSGKFYYLTGCKYRKFNHVICVVILVVIAVLLLLLLLLIVVVVVVVVDVVAAVVV